MAGTYYETGVEFDERDSSKSTSVAYAAYGDGEVILCGGIILSSADFSPVDGETAKRLSSNAKDKVKMIDLKNMVLQNRITAKSRQQEDLIRKSIMTMQQLKIPVNCSLTIKE